MTTYGEKIILQTRGFSHIINITEKVQEIISNSRITSGLACVSAIGSTASITTIEYEPALVEDMRELLEKIAPSTMKTRHSRTWGDDNGFSHLRASLMGPSVTIPFANKRLILGTWQQIVVIDHDNAPRTREIYVQVIGD
ncbi:MAG: YjbQ family protein [Candidatus Neomarinimicrobiota bacterium]|nr:YjbQ family protein [Candidatus Neomarinimicrobiota bacterium]RKY49634.1 MAG: YjbQ family protein [Candidatus Neomarinimicrobiota bacterium]HDN59181.1 YjbQ family protein [Candidatus Neomarinimicrobiota bacterium]